MKADRKDAIEGFAEKLKVIAPTLAESGLDEQSFWDSGLFQGAVERLRGQYAASMTLKREFIAEVLNHLQALGAVSGWSISGHTDRHDYEVRMADGSLAAIEAKGCLDGNNTGIFQRPPNADQFILWSLCQNSGADPRHNAWSGIHTRLSAEMISRRQQVDGLVIWDMVCSTLGRPCPKIEADAERATLVGRRNLPPPCIFLFPRTIPDPRNNPRPACWQLSQVSFLRALHGAFKGNSGDVTEVHIEAGMDGATVCRTTTLLRDGAEIIRSRPTRVKRAAR